MFFKNFLKINFNILQKKQNDRDYRDIYKHTIGIFYQKMIAKLYKLIDCRY